jgi:hypothetical protein
MVKRRDPNPAEFLNIDLDVRSRVSLAPLAAAWPSARDPMLRANPRWLVLSAHSRVQTAEATARALLKMIAALSPAGRRCWNRASKRTFDIGVQAGVGPRAFEDVQLTPRTLGRIAAIGAQLQFTVYPPQT